MADASRCPGCGAKRPANAPGRYCPRCLLRLALYSATAGQVDVDATTAPAARSAGDEPATWPGDFEATRAYIPGPGAGEPSSRTDAGGIGTTDSDDPPRTIDPDSPTRTAVGHSDTYDPSRGATVR